jgi:amino acid transporter
VTLASEQGPATLVRAIGRWSLALLTVNAIIGSGIFGLPSAVAKLLGERSPMAVLLAGAAVGVIIACYAEVASSFTGAGGPYLYARAAFGRLAGIETGWFLWLVRLTAPAAAANLFVNYLGEFIPQATGAVPRLVLLTLLFGCLAWVNYLGVRAGTRLSNVFTVAKLVPLFAVAIAGAFYVWTGHGAAAVIAVPAAGAKTWLKAMLLLIFAYGGFESPLIAMAEAKSPRRDAAFSLFAALLTCAVLYTSIQWVVLRVLPDPVHSDRPLADVARVLLGGPGAALIAVGALVSTYGYLSANMLAVPRATFAFAEQGDFPAFFAAIHPRHRTPHLSIFAFAALAWAFALFGSFTWNVTLSAMARLGCYAIGCAALPVLRRKQPGAAGFLLPGGPAFAVLAVALCAVLVFGVDLGGSIILLTTAAIGLLNWLMVRGRSGALEAV